MGIVPGRLLSVRLGPARAPFAQGRDRIFGRRPAPAGIHPGYDPLHPRRPDYLRFRRAVSGSPVPNGIKVAVGVLAVGFFFSIDLALQRERSVVLEARRSGLDWRLTGVISP